MKMPKASHPHQSFEKKETLQKLPSPVSKEENEFLNVQEVASYLCVKASTVYQWTSSKVLPYYKFGRLVRIRKQDLEEWIKKHRIEKDDQEERRLKEIFHSTQRPDLNINQIIQKCIAEEKRKGYTATLEKPGKDKGLGKEGDYGSLS